MGVGACQGANLHRILLDFGFEVSTFCAWLEGSLFGFLFHHTPCHIPAASIFFQARKSFLISVHFVSISNSSKTITTNRSNTKLYK